MSYIFNILKYNFVTYEVSDAIINEVLYKACCFVFNT